ncbi:uncharacterized protein LOC110739107 [Chenopodium quinoa]|uniref:uncharacterized protein LOC110739107 n=1 Tax=Chenopodium quinoa TaxID=63459 RepID=UPI000B785A29|nr:uncharacterized protein LOC110739107 [Chenopodium quinoa]
MQPKDSFHLKEGFKPCELPKFLKDFLSSDRTIVVGLGIDTVLKKLQSDTDLLISKQVEIRDFMQEKFGDPKYSGGFTKLDLGKLSKTLLGPEREVVKPRHILWNNGVRYGDFSDDLITYGSIKAFLVAKMYSELCDPQSAENLKTKWNVALNAHLVT